MKEQDDVFPTAEAVFRYISTMLTGIGVLAAIVILIVVFL